MTEHEQETPEERPWKLFAADLRRLSDGRVYKPWDVLPLLNALESDNAALKARIGGLESLLGEAIAPPPMPHINTKGKLNADLPAKMQRWRELEQEAVDGWCREWEGRVRAALSPTPAAP